ncbi:MBL fold metallo-hydrolase [Alicyclobacillus mengziensis]|uniref:MBL fold metallo-hydrolase n=1 Tax=Alicyclobacillus mengziensis TaxID=2931921 RepID=A0A9X7Z4R9_9BACL|nr:MBL fold metallo-hydrolase [Alicyclobacillus mengziensis]QSO45647.1 MBL fold metallo-hydrolase [Alicyclobacillus mengziensis]
MERGTYFDFYEVGTGIYAAIVHDGAGALGNAGIVDLGDRTLVFDTTQSIPAAQELKNVAKKLTGQEASLVVNSHRHNDHVLGNQVFADATIISTEVTRSVMANRLPAFLEFAKAHPEYPNQIRNRLSDASLSDQGRWEVERDLGDTEHLAAHLPEYVPTLPTLCFENQMHIYGSAREAQLLTYGSAHSASDAFMYLPEDKVLFVGDLAFIGYHPSMADGNPELWVTILGRILELEFDTVIAGHGPVGNRSHVEQTKHYVEHFIETARSNSETVNADGIPIEYRDWRGESVYFGNLKFLNGRYGRS